MESRRRRAFARLGIGPVWIARGPSPGKTAGEGVAGPDLAVQPVRSMHAAGHDEDPKPAGPGVPTTQAPVVVTPDQAWQALEAEALACRQCALCESRNRVVFGVGDRNARCLVVGEAPGAEEDRVGEPFVGRAGRLLDAMLEAVGLRRGDGVYIANVLKCRPPRNRDPEPAEVASCAPFLRRQVALLAPEVLVVMGRFAAQALLDSDASIASLRRSVHVYRVGERDVPVVVTYHPAYLLRTPSDKAKAWVDLCAARHLLAGKPATPA